MAREKSIPLNTYSRNERSQTGNLGFYLKKLEKDERKKTYIWPTGTEKDAQHHWLLGKCKKEPQWNVTSHLSGWLLPEREQSNCWQGCKERGTLLHCWGECRLVQPPRKTLWRLLRELKIELVCDPAIPLLGIYPKKTLFRKDICTPMFTDTLFITSEIWMQPNVHS